MARKILHIFILCLFVLNTSAAYASTVCLCPKDSSAQQMEMPCHNMANAEEKNQSDKKSCCGDGCLCNDLNSVKSLNHLKFVQDVSEVTFVGYTFTLQNSHDSAILTTISRPPIRS